MAFRFDILDSSDQMFNQCSVLHLVVAACRFEYSTVYKYIYIYMFLPFDNDNAISKWCAKTLAFVRIDIYLYLSHGVGHQELRSTNINGAAWGRDNMFCLNNYVLIKPLVLFEKIYYVKYAKQKNKKLPFLRCQLPPVLY